MSIWISLPFVWCRAPFDEVARRATPSAKKKAGVSCEPALGPLNTTNVAIYILIEPMITAVMATMVVIVQ